MNYSLSYHCPICFRKFPGTPTGDQMARLCCAPQSKSVFRCQCGKPYNTPEEAEKCCQVVEEEEVILKKNKKTRTFSVPSFDLNQL